MRHYALLRLLFAFFFLYIAWGNIPVASTSEASLFWGMWLVFFMLVVGANMATLLQMTRPPVMEQEQTRKRETS